MSETAEPEQPPKRSVMDVLVNAMEVISDNDADLCIVLMARSDGTLLAWRSNIDNSLTRMGLASAVVSGIFERDFSAPSK